MASADQLPPIPPVESVAHVLLPESLFDPRSSEAERKRLRRALKGAQISRPAPASDRPAPSRPEPEQHLGMVGMFVFVTTTVIAGPFLLTRNRLHLKWIRDARTAGQLIIPVQDLDAEAQGLLRIVVDVVRQVSDSRARRAGQLGDGLALLEDQQWRICTALMRLSEARGLIRRTGGELAEHQDAIRATERVVRDRIRALLAYAESVRRVDATLADIDAASRTVTLDHKLRDTVAALGEDQTVDDLIADNQQAHTAVKEALEKLRDQTELLRSSAAETL